MRVVVTYQRSARLAFGQVQELRRRKDHAQTRLPLAATSNMSR